MTPRTVADLRVSFDRLRARLDALAEVGATDAGGCARLALTDADRAGRDLVVTWMHDLGLRVDIDGVGNVVGTWPPERSDPPVMAGSHIDTVATGGVYDGNLGVLAGLEVIETVIAHGVEIEHPLAVAFFTNEEGSRFQPDMIGSLVFVGDAPVEDALAIVAVDGAVLGDELARIGYAGSRPCPSAPPHAFVELHIEQGPILHREGITIGAVTEVQGILWTEVTVIAQSNHAGTTPMSMRHDAAYTVAAITTALREHARDAGPPLVATVGRVELFPNLINVVPGRAVFTIDLRHTDEGELRAAERWMLNLCARVGAEEGVTVTTRTLARFPPVLFSDAVVEMVETIAGERGYSHRRLPSGAGHDAQMLARVCPSGMVFVPSVNGISHNPAEHTDDADLAAGVDVLLHVMLELAGARLPQGAHS